MRVKRFPHLPLYLLSVCNLSSSSVLSWPSAWMKVWCTEHRRISWMLNYIIRSRFSPASHVSSGWLGCNLSISTCSLHQSWAINHQTNLDHCPLKHRQSDGSCRRCVSFFLFVACRNICFFITSTCLSNREGNTLVSCSWQSSNVPFVWAKRARKQSCVTKQPVFIFAGAIFQGGFKPELCLRPECD